MNGDAETADAGLPGAFAGFEGNDSGEVHAKSILAGAGESSGRQVECPRRRGGAKGGGRKS
jgi:hypothetical protein